MQKTITQPKIKIHMPLGENPGGILNAWKNVLGIWEKKKTDPIQHLKKIRKEWETKKI